MPPTPLEVVVPWTSPEQWSKAWDDDDDYKDDDDYDDEHVNLCMAWMTVG